MGEDLEAFTEKYALYLEDIRMRFYRVAIIFVAAFLVGMFCTQLILPFFVHFLSIQHVTIVATSPFQLLELTMNVGFFTALIFTIPFAFHQVFTFLGGGLFPHEKRMIVVLIPLSLFLFCLGFVYGVGVMYVAIEYIATANASFGITNLWDISQFISQILITSALLGIIFEFPLVLIALMRFNLLSIDFLRRNRRGAIATILIFVALLPPTDGLSFIVMSVPLVVMYEATILVSTITRRKELLQT